MLEEDEEELEEDEVLLTHDLTVELSLEEIDHEERTVEDDLSTSTAKPLTSLFPALPARLRD